jgi:hypothetical protein
MATVFWLVTLVFGIVMINHRPSFQIDGSAIAFFYTVDILGGVVLGVMLAAPPTVSDVTSKDVEMTSSSETLACETTDIQLADHAPPSTLRSRCTSPVAVSPCSVSPASSVSSWVQMSPPLTLSASLLANDSLGGQHV